MSPTQTSSLDEVPQNAPEHCPGTSSENAGKSAACAGCPNQSICASAPKGPDPDIPIIEKSLMNVKRIILVLSGKGGVGKSTFSSQLAFALAHDVTQQVGLMDIDICGPSIPKIMGVEGEQVHQSGSGWSPVYVEDNLAVMSIGFILPDPDEAVIWRGPKKNGLIKQFLRDVEWGEIDYLIVDTPPGTSDEHLSISQLLKTKGIDGAVIITTPQEVALNDVRKEINFCKKTNIPILGIVENMSVFICPKCHGQSEIFSRTSGGAKKLAEDYQVDFLGSIPLDPRIVTSCDSGQSFLEKFPDSFATKTYLQIIEQIKTKVDNK